MVSPSCSSCALVRPLSKANFVHKGCRKLFLEKGYFSSLLELWLNHVHFWSPCSTVATQQSHSAWREREEGRERRERPQQGLDLCHMHSSPMRGPASCRLPLAFTSCARAASSKFLWFTTTTVHALTGLALCHRLQIDKVKIPGAIRSLRPCCSTLSFVSHSKSCCSLLFLSGNHSLLLLLLPADQ